MLFPPEIYNLVVLFSCAILVYWFFRVCSSSFSLSFFQLALRYSRERLVRMDLISRDQVLMAGTDALQRLIRTHVDTSKEPLLRVKESIHAKKLSFRLLRQPSSSASSLTMASSVTSPKLSTVSVSSDDLRNWGLQFEFDSNVDCAIQLIWGVDARSFKRRRRQMNADHIRHLEELRTQRPLSITNEGDGDDRNVHAQKPGRIQLAMHTAAQRVRSVFQSQMHNTTASSATTRPNTDGAGPHLLLNSSDRHSLELPEASSSFIEIHDFTEKSTDTSSQSHSAANIARDNAMDLADSILAGVSYSFKSSVRVFTRGMTQTYITTQDDVLSSEQAQRLLQPGPTTTRTTTTTTTTLPPPSRTRQIYSEHAGDSHDPEGDTRPIDPSVNNKADIPRPGGHEMSSNQENAPRPASLTYPLIVVIRGLRNSPISFTTSDEEESITHIIVVDFLSGSTLDSPSPSSSSTSPPPLASLEPCVLQQFVETSTASYVLKEIYGMEYKDGSDVKREEPLRQVADERECVICLNANRNAVALPCRHMCACLRCFKQVDKCPVCRTKIQSYIVIKRQLAGSTRRRSPRRFRQQQQQQQQQQHPTERETTDTEHVPQGLDAV